MLDDESLYAMALTRISNFNFNFARAAYAMAGSAKGVYDMRHDICRTLPACTPRIRTALADWSEPLKRAEAEREFAARHAISILTPADGAYPARLKECPDAPLALYYKGTADLNATRIVSIVGTRHCTPYGRDMTARLVKGLQRLCPGTLVVSGLAYGIDIEAHRNALACGLPTVGVLAHGLDTIYPPRHRDTAGEMVAAGGLLTEYMSATNADKANFVRRNRIVAGMCDATVLVESGGKGGGLITLGIAAAYNRETFAVPGQVGAPYSEGCNNAIRDNRAALVTSADDLAAAMGWQSEELTRRELRRGIELDLFPELTDGEQRIADLLRTTNDLQLNAIATQTGIAVGQVTAMLFQLEMKGVVKALAGGVYHLVTH